MLTNLFENIYSKKLTVYDIMTGKLWIRGCQEIEKEFGSDLSRIGKTSVSGGLVFQSFTNKIIKENKSVSFAYELKRGSGLPVGYKALFSLNMEK